MVQVRSAQIGAAAASFAPMLLGLNGIVDYGPGPAYLPARIAFSSSTVEMNYFNTGSRMCHVTVA